MAAQCCIQPSGHSPLWLRGWPELRPADGPSIAPELILAQRGQSESDYQLALALSKNDNDNAATVTTTRLDEEDGKLIDAVKELSIKTFHGEANATLNVSSGNSNNNANIFTQHKEQKSMIYYI